MKQTATDYLYECFIDLFRQYTEGEIDGGKFGELITEAHQQAKEMEKQDFITCASNGFNHAYDFLKIKE
jgi:hypothetical protein